MTTVQQRKYHGKAEPVTITAGSALPGFTTLIIVRHGETEANIAQVWQGALDAPLTTKGERQADAAAERLRDLNEIYPVDHFYVSPLGRTQRTAAPIATALELDPVLDDGLREFDLGDWEGRSFEDLRGIERLWERWAQDPTFRPPNGESPYLVNRRSEAIYDELAQRHPGETILTVTHGGIICNVLANWLGDGPQDWQNWHPHNCAITILRQNGDGWDAILSNDISHLPSELLRHSDRTDYAEVKE